MTTLTLNEAADFLRQGDDFLILTHGRADGDTIGSASALCHLLRGVGKQAFLQPNEDLTPRLDFLCQGLFAPEGFIPSLVVAADVATQKLLCKSAAPWGEKVDLCIDHHPSNSGYAARTLLDPRCAATGELIWLLGEQIGYAVTPAFCDAVYTAISTDTGCFCYSNTTPQTHRIAALCMEGGADISHLNRDLFETKSWKRIQVENYVFQNLSLFSGEKIAGICLTQQEMDKLEATKDELDNLSSLPRQIKGVVCSILLTPVGENRYKASVRTDAPVDASQLCARFGGGGHARAAGCTLEGEGRDCLARLVKAAQEALGYV